MLRQVGPDEADNERRREDEGEQIGRLAGTEREGGAASDGESARRSGSASETGKPDRRTGSQTAGG